MPNDCLTTSPTASGQAYRGERALQLPPTPRLDSAVRPNDPSNGARMKRALLAATFLSLALAGVPSRADVHPRADSASPPTALDHYVAAPDPSYGYKVNSTFSADGLTATVLR